MSPERLREIEELYHAARERPLEDRAELLAQADPEVRREVESLLAQNGENLLDRPCSTAVQVGPKEDGAVQHPVVNAIQTGVVPA